MTQAVEFTEMRLRSGEKTFYKELNKRPEIMFPIPVDIALVSHKAGILIQSELGGASPPDGDQHRKHHQQWNTDKSIALSHARRLIRCIIDCQVYLKDAVAVRNALDLARSLSARAWDSTPRQLKQVPEIGDVLCRKLTSKGINSIEKLLSSEPHQIEMAVGRQHPFGNKLLNAMEAYPLLHVSVKEIGRKFLTGQGTDLKLRAEIGFMNEKPPKLFNKTPIFVCFFVEDSHGSLHDFRRFWSAKMQSKEEICFTTHLTKPTDFVRCYVTCDEIVGTCRHAELQISKIPLSAFPVGTKAAQSKSKQPSEKAAPATEDPFELCDIADDDLLAVEIQNGIEVVNDLDVATAAVQNARQQPQKQPTASQSLTQEVAKEQEPTQWSNGRWACRHTCKAKGLQCKHNCCRDGLEKPPRKTKATAPAPEHGGLQRKITEMPRIATKVKTSAEQTPDNVSSGLSTTRSELNLNAESSEVKKVVDDALERARAGTQHETPRFDASQSSMTDLDRIFDIDELDDLFDSDESDRMKVVSKEGQPNVESNDYGDKRNSGDFDTATDPSLPPVSHISMREVQKQPDPSHIVTGETSSSFKLLTSSELSPEKPSGQTMVISRPSPGYTVSKTTPEDLPGPSHPLTGPSTITATATGGHVSNAAAIEPEPPQKPETERQRKHRLWEENQRRLWSKLPPWMYEQFGHCTELVE
jgi:hypothetical protein